MMVCASSAQFDPPVLRARLKDGKVLACRVLRGGRTVFEYDKNLKTGEDIHRINSCTKSVISALTGICIKERLLGNPDTPISEYLGSLVTSQRDTRKHKITIGHLLTMSAGFDWPEFGEWHFFAPMGYSRDILQFILDRDLAAEPGASMNYNSGCSHLLSAIIGRVTGMTAAEYASDTLFAPLGITQFKWYEKQGVSLGADGLRLRIGDMAKFGQLYLQSGTWGAKEIIPAEWVRQSAIPRYTTYRNIGSYGWHWWIAAARDNSGGFIPFYFALGLGGQYILVVPDLDLVTAFICGDYGDPLLPMKIFREYIIGKVIV